MLTEINKSLSVSGFFILTTRVDGQLLNFDDIVEYLRGKFRIIHVFSVHRPKNYLSELIRKAANILNPILDPFYEIVVKNMDPKKSFMTAFICLPLH